MTRLLCAVCLVACFFCLPAGAEPVTFTRDIAPILYAHCAECHRADEIGPFPLLDYQDVQKRDRLIAKVVARRTMPPWKPEEGHGEFIEERRLTDDQIATIEAWVNAGAPEGDPAHLPPLPALRTGWRLGEPDLVMTMPEPFTIPAEGYDLYQHFVFPLKLDAKQKYLRAVEVRPGNRRVVHHAAGFLDLTGRARRLDAADPKQGYTRFGGPGFIPAGFTPGFVPGQTPRFFPGNSGITLRKGMDLVLQVHYHPIGRTQTDQTTVGLYFTDQKPARYPTGILLGSESIDIPAGEKAHVIRDSFTLPVDLQAVEIWAHMHNLGKSVRVWAELPDGSTKYLLKISDWDFNWQDVYRYKKPFKLPRGTTVHAEFTYDNSADNPRNPNAPPKRVTFGETSTDEMAGVVIGGLADNTFGEWTLLAANIKHYAGIYTEGKRSRAWRHTTAQP